MPEEKDKLVFERFNQSNNYYVYCIITKNLNILSRYNYTAYKIINRVNC